MTRCIIGGWMICLLAKARKRARTAVRTRLSVRKQYGWLLTYCTVLVNNNGHLMVILHCMEKSYAQFSKRREFGPSVRLTISSRV